MGLSDQIKPACKDWTDYVAKSQRKLTEAGAEEKPSEFDFDNSAGCAG